MVKYFSLLLFFSLFKIDSCTEMEIQSSVNSNEILGDWIYKNRFLGDAIDTPCGYAVTNVRELTLKVEENTENKENLKLTGNSAVNMLFADLKILTFDKATGIGTLKIEHLGSTKMAGPPDLMQCEQGYFEMLNDAADFKIENNKLMIGHFKKDNTPSRDGGTYMIFEKAK